MIAEHGRLLGQVAVDVEHSAVVVSEDADAVCTHARRHARRIDPVGDLLPSFLVLQVARDQVIRNAGAVEHASDFRGRTTLAMLQPHARHHPPVAEPVEGIVVQLGRRLEAEHDQRRPRFLNDRQDRARQGVGGDIEEDQIDLLASEAGGGLSGLVGIVDHSHVDQLRSHALQPLGDDPLASAQTLQEAVKLRPVRLQPDAEQSDPRLKVRLAVHKRLSLVGKGGRLVSRRSVILAQIGA